MPGPPKVTVKKATAKKAAAPKPADDKAADDTGGEASGGTTGTTAPSVEAVLTRYQSIGVKSMNEYASLVSNAARRLSGDTTDGAGGWAEDAIAFWGKVARDQVNLLSMVTDLMAASYRQSEGKGG